LGRKKEGRSGVTAKNAKGAKKKKRLTDTHDPLAGCGVDSEPPHPQRRCLFSVYATFAFFAVTPIPRSYLVPYVIPFASRDEQ
jgi:hypothetical protein